MYQVIFHCLSCQSYNKHHRGEPESEMKQVEFESFSEAWTHMMENPKHNMDISAREEVNDAD